MADSYYNLANELAKAYSSQSIYPTLGSAISGVDFYDRYASPWTNLAINIAKGLIGGGISGYGQGKAQALRDEALVAIPTIEAGLDYEPTNLDDDQMGLIKKVAYADLMSKAHARQALRDELQIKAEYAGLEKQKIIEGENEAYGFMGGENPDSPQFKKAQLELQNKNEAERLGLEKSKYITDLEQKAQELITTKDPNAVAAGQMFPAFQTLQDLIGAEKGPATDLAVKASVARILDPVGAVGRDSTELAAKAQPLWDQYVGNFSGLIGRDGYFSPESRLKIVEALSTRVGPIAENYQKLVENQSDVLTARGGLPTSLNPIPYHPYVKQPVSNQGGPAGNNIAAEYAALKATKGDAQARAEILLKYGASAPAVTPTLPTAKISDLIGSDYE